MMRTIVNIVLIVIIGLLVWALISGIREPIAFQKEKERRERAVINRLIDIRTTQELYRGVTGAFAHNFDTLKQVLTQGEFQVIQVFGDPDDPTNSEAIVYDTIYMPAIDSVRSLGINLDSLPFVPFSQGARFSIDADTLTYQQTLVHVVEVSTPRTVFMGDYADPRFRRYDSSYDPKKPLKFGDMSTPNIAGNWER